MSHESPNNLITNEKLKNKRNKQLSDLALNDSFGFWIYFSSCIIQEMCLQIVL